MSSFPCAAVHGDFFLALFETLVSRIPPQEFWCFLPLQMSQFIPFPLSMRATTKLDCMFSQSGSMWILYNEDIFNNAISVMLIVRLSALTYNDNPSKNTTWLSDFPVSIWIFRIGDSTDRWSGAASWTIPWISFDTTRVNSSAPSSLKLGDCRWQEVMQREVGFKISLFENATSSTESTSLLLRKLTSPLPLPTSQSYGRIRTPIY